MRVFLFAIVAICIAGYRAQEIAIGTDYLRTHFNDSIASATNAQEGETAPNVIIVNPAVNVEPPETSSSSTTSTTTSAAPQVNEAIDNAKQGTTYDHEHQSHHAHDATISVDVHNILDLFKQQLSESEARIIAAISSNQPAAPAIAVKSYRTAERSTNN